MSYLGLDIGGSHCRHALLPAGPRGTRPGVPPLVHGEAAAVRAVAAVLRELGERASIDQAVVCMAGAGDRQVAERLGSGLRTAGVTFPVVVTGDVVAAAAAALRDGPGVAVWSGTGSFAVARGSDGRLHRTGGRGFLLGDEGSGYDLVRNAARAAVAAADGRGPATLLAEVMTAAFGASSPLRLGAVLQGLEPAKVAARLSLVLDAAVAGDATAVSVIEAGANALRALAEAAALGQGLALAGCEVVLGGGVLQNATPVQQRLSAALTARGARVRLLADELATAVGAAALAEARHLRLQPLSGWLDP